jgi:hypothetical protein
VVQQRADEIIPEDTYLLFVSQMGRCCGLGGHAGLVLWSSLFLLWAARWRCRFVEGLNAKAVNRPARNRFKQIIVALAFDRHLGRAGDSRSGGCGHRLS